MQPGDRWFALRATGLLKDWSADRRPWPRQADGGSLQENRLTCWCAKISPVGTRSAAGSDDLMSCAAPPERKQELMLVKIDHSAEMSTNTITGIWRWYDVSARRNGARRFSRRSFDGSVCVRTPVPSPSSGTSRTGLPAVLRRTPRLQVVSKGDSLRYVAINPHCALLGELRRPMSGRRNTQLAGRCSG